MKYKIALFIVIVFFLNVTLMAVSPSKHDLVPSGHWVYDAISALAIETGTINFAQNAPLSMAELNLYLLDINFEKLSLSGKNAYYSVLDYFNREYPAYGNEVFSFGTDLVVSPELRYISNDEAFNENELPVSYSKRNKLIEIPLIASISDFAVIRMNLSVASNYESYKDTSVFHNIPTKVDYLDANFPQTSYISTGLSTPKGIDFFNFHLGQNHLSVGRTETGSIILSDSLYGANYAQMSFFTENLRYTNTPIQLEAEKYLYLHRIEVRVFDRIAIGLLEGLLISKPFELRYLNPASIFHSLVTWADYDDNQEDLYGDSHSSAYFGVTFDINPWKYIRLYGLMAMNQFTFDFELTEENIDNSYANAIGGQLGIESFVPFYKGYFHSGVEGVYALPWLYKNKETNPSPSFYNSTLLLGSENRNQLNTWVGYPYGPDTITAYLHLGYVEFNTWSAYLSYRYMINGEVTFDTAYPTTSDSILADTPYGVPSYEHTFGISGFYRALDWLTTEASLSYTISKNAQNIQSNLQSGVSLTIGFSMELSEFVSFE